MAVDGSSIDRIRPGRADDLPVLVALLGAADRAGWRVRAAELGEEALLVAERAGDAVGTVSVRWDGRCDPPHPWLYGLHVRADARRHGVGATLVDEAAAAARDRRAAALSLDVDRGEDRLVEWYRRLGFEPVGPHEHHWQAVDPSTGRVTAEGTADTWLMRREL